MRVLHVDYSSYRRN